MKKKSTRITLKNIDTEHIQSKYNVAVKKVPELKIDCHNQDVTFVSDLHHGQNITLNSFIQGHSNLVLTMIDSLTSQELQRTNCFWCRHDFKTLPIGCPLRYVDDRIVKTCKSEITKEQYTVSQTIPTYVQPIENPAIQHVKSGHYVTDGCFCSFNCCAAFIQDNIHNPIYFRSKYLLNRLFVELFGPEKSFPPPAPSFRMLKAYGGNLTIEDFRESFSTHMFTPIGYVDRIPKIYSVGFKYDSQIVI